MKKTIGENIIKSVDGFFIKTGNALAYTVKINLIGWDMIGIQE